MVSILICEWMKWLSTIRAWPKFRRVILFFPVLFLHFSFFEILLMGSYLIGFLLTFVTAIFRSPAVWFEWISTKSTGNLGSAHFPFFFFLHPKKPLLFLFRLLSTVCAAISFIWKFWPELHPAKGAFLFFWRFLRGMCLFPAQLAAIHFGTALLIYFKLLPAFRADSFLHHRSRLSLRTKLWRLIPDDMPWLSRPCLFSFRIRYACFQYSFSHSREQNIVR